MKDDLAPDPATVKADIKKTAIEILGEMVSEVSATPELKKARNDIVNKTLTAWAGNSRFKNMLAGFVSRRITAKDHPFALPPTRPEELKLWGNMGTLTLLGIRFMAAMDRENPQWMAQMMETPLKRTLANVDFGELYEMIDGSEDRVLAVQAMLQRVINEFPIKFGLAPAIKLRMVNMNLKKKNMTLASIEDMAPDMLARTFLSLIEKLIEGREIGELADRIAGLVRKIHAGGVMEGEAGKSLLEIVLTQKLREILPEIKPEIFRKAVIGLAELKESTGNALTVALEENPALMLELIASRAAIRNPGIRRQGRKAAMLAELPSGELADAMAKGISDLDAEEVAGTVNNWLRIINHLNERHPEKTIDLLASCAAMIDPDELETAVRWLMPGAVDAMRPVAGILMPELIRGFCRLVEPQPGQDTADMDNALAMLRRMILDNGEGSL
jgi:hypothetical protein